MPPEPFTPTHAVPPAGLATWAAADPSRSSDGWLDANLPVQIVSQGAGWARVRCSNGWECWVDGRALLPLQSAGVATGPQPVQTAGASFAPTNQVPNGGLAARVQPLATDPVASWLPAGLAVQALSEHNGWWQVRCDNGWEAWVDGSKLVPLGSRVDAGTANPLAVYVPLGAAVVVVLASFLPWFTALGDSASAWDIPLRSLLDTANTSKNPESAWILLVVGATLIPLLTRAPLPRVLLVVIGLVPILVALGAIRLLTDLPSEVRPDVGVGLVLTLVAGAVIAGSAAFPPTN